MSRKNLYSIIVTVYDKLRQWKVELHKESGEDLTGSSIFSARVSMDKELPEFIQARMNMVDMGHDVNARARITDGIGSRYIRSDGRVVQYFLHDITEAQAKEVGLLQNHKLRGKRAKGIIVGDLTEY